MDHEIKKPEHQFVEDASLNHTSQNDNMMKDGPAMEALEIHDKAWERKTIWKVDLRLLVILGLCYAVSLIDRTNISIARVAGMDAALGLSVGERYSIISLLFFVPYIIFELPSNMILRRVGARNWLTLIVLGFGIVMIGMAFVTTWWQLAICRVLLGSLESGFFPGCVYLVSSWYTRYETNSRMAVFYLTSMVISGFSNIAGYGMSTLSGRNGLLGWQWVFLICGIITCILGVLAALLIVDFPEKSKFLTVEQKDWVMARIEKDRGDSIPDKLSLSSFARALSDWKIWCYAYCFMTATTGAYAFAFFLPVILAGQGFSTQLSLILSAPPYVFAAIYTFILAVFSDKVKLRAPFIAGSNILCITGLLITAYADNLGARYFGCFFTIAGAQSNVPAVLAYSQNNIRMSSKRSVTSALVIGFGGIGGIIASTVYRQADYPRYIPGLWTTVGLNAGSVAMVSVLSMVFIKKNRAAQEGASILEGHEDFRYTI